MFMSLFTSSIISSHYFSHKARPQTDILILTIFDHFKSSESDFTSWFCLSIMEYLFCPLCVDFQQRESLTLLEALYVSNAKILWEFSGVNHSHLTSTNWGRDFSQRFWPLII